MEKISVQHWHEA